MGKTIFGEIRYSELARERGERERERAHNRSGRQRWMAARSIVSKSCEAGKKKNKMNKHLIFICSTR